MTHGSLFSGIGGFDLAAQCMGWDNVFHCEIDPFCQKVLAHHFPNSTPYEDVTKFEATKYRGRIDVLSGGFPCQPFSQAGKRKGTEDSRHLWPAMLEVIRGVSPRWVVGENVYGITSWSDGLVFEQVCTDLEDAGYEITPYILPACGVNAPHQRSRVFFIAYANGPEPKSDEGANAKTKGEVRRNEEGDVFRELPSDGASTNTGRGAGTFDEFPSFSPLCGGDDGISQGLDGITFPKWRSESIKAYGNAVVPPLIFQIFKAIEAFENL